MRAAGFEDQALGAQTVFRTLLDALAAPGEPRALPRGLPPAPAGLGAGAYAAALALVDFETPLWLAPELASAADDLRFRTGAPLVVEPERAAFALARDPARLPALADFAAGSDLYPDRSTTLLLAVDRLSRGGEWRLRGPGIRDVARLGVAGLPFDFVAQWAENRARFPRGVDVLLFAGSVVCGLPRTVRIEEE